MFSYKYIERAYGCKYSFDIHTSIRIMYMYITGTF